MMTKQDILDLMTPLGQNIIRISQRMVTEGASGLKKEDVKSDIIMAFEALMVHVLTGKRPETAGLKDDPNASQPVMTPDKDAEKHSEGETGPKIPENLVDKMPEESGDDFKRKICRYFLLGKCRNNKSDCRFDHPSSVCQRFRKYGATGSGCTRGRKCPHMHVRHCVRSIQGLSCKGQDCKSRYHLQNHTTKPETCVSANGERASKEKDFLGAPTSEKIKDDPYQSRLRSIEETLEKLAPMMKLVEMVVSSTLKNQFGAGLLGGAQNH